MTFQVFYQKQRSVVLEHTTINAGDTEEARIKFYINNPQHKLFKIHEKAKPTERAKP